jgi:DNA-binding GntR family transcriptional regulator
VGAAVSATRTEQVAALLREAIVRGDYLSGERMVELSLAKSLHVSQNTVRDALRILEHDGWVVKYARRGVYVRKFTADEAAEIFALLGAVELMVLTWAMQALTKAVLSDLKGLVNTARSHADTGAWRASIEALFGFHERLGQAAGKPFTTRLMEQLYNQIRLLEAVRQVRAPRNPHELNAHIRRHESLYYYIEAGDEAGAQRLLQEQLQLYGEAVLAAL